LLADTRPQWVYRPPPVHRASPAKRAKMKRASSFTAFMPERPARP